MRILHVTDTYLPRLGGIELHVSDLARRQRAAGHQVLVLTAEPLLKNTANDHGPVPVSRIGKGLGGAGIAVSLAPVVAGFAPDVLHAHLTVGSPFTWAVLRNTAGLPVLASVHSLLPRAPRLIAAGIRLVGLPLTRMTFTAVSEVAAARLRPALGADQPVHVLHNGIDPADWSVRHRPSEEFSILAVGRLAARKRPLVLVDALAELAAAAPELDWSAAIVGAGPQRTKVATAIRARGLENRITLPGALSREAIRQRLAGADVLVAPATLESFGIAALEARCAGVPIVGMAASGVTEFVTDGVDGLLARTDADIAGCLRRLATDRELAASIRRHNTLDPVAMQWPAVLAQHQSLYEAAVRRTRIHDHRAPVLAGAVR